MTQFTAKPVLVPCIVDQAGRITIADAQGRAVEVAHAGEDVRVRDRRAYVELVAFESTCDMVRVALPAGGSAWVRDAA